MSQSLNVANVLEMASIIPGECISLAAARMLAQAAKTGSKHDCMWLSLGGGHGCEPMND